MDPRGSTELHMSFLVTSDEVKLYLALNCFLKSPYLYIRTYDTTTVTTGYYLGARDAPLGALFLRNFGLGVWKLGQLSIDVI